LLSLYTETLQRQGKGRTQNSFFKGYLKLVVFTMLCGNDSVRPATEGHPPAAGNGGGKSRNQLGFESPAFH
jgi:hypothetical protein